MRTINRIISCLAGVELAYWVVLVIGLLVSYWMTGDTTKLSQFAGIAGVCLGACCAIRWLRRDAQRYVDKLRDEQDQIIH